MPGPKKGEIAQLLWFKIRKCLFMQDKRGQRIWKRSPWHMGRHTHTHTLKVTTWPSTSHLICWKNPRARNFACALCMRHNLLITHFPFFPTVSSPYYYYAAGEGGFIKVRVWMKFAFVSQLCDRISFSFQAHFRLISRLNNKTNCKFGFSSCFASLRNSRSERLTTVEASWNAKWEKN